MTNRDHPPTALAGEFPFAVEGLDSPFALRIPRPGSVDLTIEGSATVVRPIQTPDRFGLLATGVGPGTVLDVRAADASAATVWDALGRALLALAAADCGTAEMLDYLAVEKCGIGPEEWARLLDSRRASPKTIRSNATKASRQLAGDE